MKKRFLLWFWVLLFCQNALASSLQPWSQWVVELRQEAVSQGISPTLFDSLFDTMTTPQSKVLGLARTQPEHRLNYPQYLKTRADNYRIVYGQKKYAQYKNVLHSIEQEYGVDSCIIVALWGMETSYGNFMGSFPTIQALATLAYQSNRPAFFRKELLHALHMLNDNQVSLSEFKGEWAGASGQCQFLPSSWYNYAVDYDGDGRKNIWSSVPDVLASIANYMKMHGWETGQPVTMNVQLPPSFNPIYVQTREIKTLREWADLGILQANGQALPNSHATAFLVHPDSGPVWLAFNNFQVILSYNNSIYYAGAIHYMAGKICHRR